MSLADVMINKIVLESGTSNPASKSFQKRVGRLAQGLQDLPLDIRAVGSSIPETTKVYPHLLLSSWRTLRPINVFPEFVIAGPGEVEYDFKGLETHARWGNYSFRIWLPRGNTELSSRYIISLQVPTLRVNKSGELATRYTECIFDFGDGKVRIH